jgi:hypothetical protein
MDMNDEDRKLLTNFIGECWSGSIKIDVDKERKPL